MKISKLTLASILFTSIIILWPILTYISIPEGGSFKEQLQSIEVYPLIYIINYIIAFLIAPAIIYMLFELFKVLSGNSWSIISKLGFILYGLYFILISISYGSQFLYLPFIIQSGSKSEILNWYFYNDNSIVILINQTAYLIWSIATLMIFTKYFFLGNLQFFIVKLLSLSAIAQLIASIGFFIDKPNLSSLSFYSGLLLLPVGILIIIFGFKNQALE